MATPSPARPLVLAATLFCVGVLFAPSRALGFDGGLLVALVFGGLWATRRRRVVAALLAPPTYFLAGLATASLAESPVETVTAALGGETGVLEGRLVEAPERSAEREVWTLDVSSAGRAPEAMRPARGRVRLTLPAGPPGCARPGARVRVGVRVREVGDPLTPYQPSPRVWAARRGVALVGRGVAPYVCLGAGAELRFAPEQLRAAVHDGIERVLPGPEGGVVRAFATGDRAGLGPDTERVFRDSGLSHLLAISGLNLAIVSGLFVIGLGLLLGRSARIAETFGASRLAATAGVPFVVFYTLFVGASPSAVRSAIMVLALLVAKIADRVADAWNALALAVLLMVAWDPGTLGDVSFQLSFAAVAALLRLQPALEGLLGPGFPAWPAPVRWATRVVLASAAATLGTLPLVARHFSRVSLIGVLANLPAQPLSSLVLVPLSLLGGLAAVVSDALARPLLAVAGATARALVGVAELAAAVPGAALDVPRPSMVAVVLAYTASIGLSLPRERRRGRAIGGLALALLAVGGGIRLVEARLRSETVVSFLPVGHGDSALLELPGGKNVLIDTGSAWAAERVVVPYLLGRGVTHLDLVILTHPHADHMAGLADLEARVSVAEVWWNGDRRFDDEAAATTLARLLARVPAVGEAFRAGEAHLEVVGPATAQIGVNDGSLVVRLSQGGRSVLFVGDAEREAERSLLAEGRELRADVLKVGHHGSRTSSGPEFLAAVRPDHAVLSFGRFDGFGFPHAEVVARLTSAGIESWRTPDDGVIWVQLGGSSLAVGAYRRGDREP